MATFDKFRIGDIVYVGSSTAEVVDIQPTNSSDLDEVTFRFRKNLSELTMLISTPVVGIWRVLS